MNNSKVCPIQIWGSPCNRNLKISSNFLHPPAPPMQNHYNPTSKATAP